MIWRRIAFGFDNSRPLLRLGRAECVHYDYGGRRGDDADFTRMSYYFGPLRVDVTRRCYCTVIERSIGEKVFEHDILGADGRWLANLNPPPRRNA